MTSRFSFACANLGKSVFEGVIRISFRARTSHKISVIMVVFHVWVFLFFVFSGNHSLLNNTFIYLFHFPGSELSGSRPLTVLSAAGDPVQQHQASVQLTHVLLHRKLKRDFKHTVVSPCLEFKHKLLLGRVVCLPLALLHDSS